MLVFVAGPHMWYTFGGMVDTMLVVLLINAIVATVIPAFDPVYV